eukprot:TRINITY_DN407_c0_g1_i1.p1 TRINITY_DN407_c0_g1~~TRINITY_DN407_c0_g1_i1.p1  ORF type:complete len:377 (+),score=100.71 TRINITY_DN407_c0_g1_i1:95-1225(+)
MTEVIEKLSDSVVSEIASICSYNYEDDSSIRAVKKEILLEIRTLGIKQFVAHLRKDDLAKFTKKISKKILTSYNQNSITVAVLRKRLLETLEEKGWDRYMAKLNPPSELIKSALKSMTGEKAKSSLSQAQLLDLLSKEILSFGLEEYLLQFPLSLLKKITIDIGIAVKSSSKTVYARSITNQTDYEPVKRVPKKKKKKVEQSDDDSDDVEQEDEQNDREEKQKKMKKSHKQEQREEDEQDKQNDNDVEEDRQLKKKTHKVVENEEETEEIDLNKGKNKIIKEEENIDKENKEKADKNQNKLKNKNTMKPDEMSIEEDNKKVYSKKGGGVETKKNIQIKNDEETESYGSSSSESKKRKNMIITDNEDEKPVLKKKNI